MKRLFFLIIYFLSVNCTQAQLISTFAGNGSAGYSGDGGAATAARLNNAINSVFDASGNQYVADAGNNCVRKITRAGVITTVAGTGTPGYSGDGGYATAAKLYTPRGVALDASGNLYIADKNNNRIRKVDLSGIITTIAGNSSGSYGGDGGPATAAQISEPFGVAINGDGMIYIADQGNNRIRKIDTTGIISTIAGNGTSGYSGDGAASTAASLNSPAGICVDRYGNVFIADLFNHSIRVAYTYGLIYTIAGNGTFGFSGDGGPATAAKLFSPLGVCVTDSGVVYIADASNNRIRKIDLGGRITTIAGNGSSGYSGDGGRGTAAALSVPASAVFDREGNMYVCDHNNHVIRKLLLNYGPGFTGGHHQTMTICENDPPVAINTLMAATDSEVGQAAIWSVAASPPHGYLTAAHTSVFSGGVITPSGLTYAPLSAYSGNDTFSVRVSDGYRSDTTTVIVTVRPLPLGGYIRGADSTCPGAYDTLDNPTATPGGTWSHTDTFITIGATTGIVYGRSPGTENVIYSVTTVCGTATATLPVTVNTNPFSGTIVGPDSVCIGASISLSNPTATPGGLWTSSDTAVATISSSGVVTGRRGGRTFIYYNAHTYCGSSPALHVVDVKPYAGAITGADTVCLGDTVDLSETVYTGTWSSSAAGIATIASWGRVVGAAVGTAVISYSVTSGTCGTAFVTHPLHVITAPARPAISGASTICETGSTTLAGSISGGVWGSSNTAAATIDSVTGIVTGVAVGATYISYAVANVCGTSSATISFYVNTTPAVTSLTGADSVCAGGTATATGTPASGTWALSNGNASLLTGTATTRAITGITAGFDTITYTVTNSCGSASLSKQVKILAAPDAGTITGLTRVCQGGYITLGNAITGGTWSATNARATITTTGLLSGITAGMDTIYYAVTNSCGTATARHIVTIDPLPVAGVITGSSIVCPGSTTTLTSSTTGGTWSAITGNTTVNSSGVVTGVSIGTDTIHYTTTNACGSASAIKVMSVNAAITASVTNTVSADSVTCSGEGVTFTALPVNGGSAPYITWMKAGSAVATGATYSYTPANGDAVYCTMVSNDICSLHDTVSSNTITMDVSAVPLPFTVVTASPNDTVAFIGQEITYTANLTYCGPSPSYQWFLNGAAVAGATSATYTRNIFTYDTVQCLVLCNTACVATIYNRSNIVIVCPVPPLAVSTTGNSIAGITLYPNPNQREFFIDGNINTTASNLIDIAVTDMPGRVLYHTTATAFNGTLHEKISLNSSIAKGLYLVKISCGNEVRVMRFVVGD